MFSVCRLVWRRGLAHGRCVGGPLVRRGLPLVRRARRGGRRLPGVQQCECARRAARAPPPVAHVRARPSPPTGWAEIWERHGPDRPPHRSRRLAQSPRAPHPPQPRSPSTRPARARRPLPLPLHARYGVETGAAKVHPRTAPLLVARMAFFFFDEELDRYHTSSLTTTSTAATWPSAIMGGMAHARRACPDESGGADRLPPRHLVRVWMQLTTVTTPPGGDAATGAAARREGGEGGAGGLLQGGTGHGAAGTAPCCLPSPDGPSVLSCALAVWIGCTRLPRPCHGMY